MERSQLFEDMKKAIIEGDSQKAESLAKKSLQNQIDPRKAINSGFIPGIQEVGKMWEKGEYFLPELMTSANAMKSAMALLRPELKKSQVPTKSRGRVVIGTVEGDIHDVGKSLVASMLSANGFEVTDLGADVKLDKFLQSAQKKKAHIICLSALLTTTMLGQKRFIEMLKEKKLKTQYKILVGGAPTTQKWADEIEADGYAENALSAIQLALKVMGHKGSLQ
ncbi:corrinoid protein [bacterium]|nr:corrinoid protein [bacterium]